MPATPTTASAPPTIPATPSPLRPTAAVAASPTAAASPTDLVVSVTPVTEPPVPTGTTIGGTPGYLDDRSSGSAVLWSYFNAINRHEYDRAYSYWVTGQSGLPPYDQFKQGYADTQAITSTVGPEWGQGAAGSRYTALAVGLTTTLTTGAHHYNAGCYTFGLTQPMNQNVPPFRPWSIWSVTTQSLPATDNLADRLAAVCLVNGNPPGLPARPTRVSNVDDVSDARYLDDRSTPEEVLRSLFNAINRREYDRAYSYWETGAQQLPPYDQFRQGYTTTASVRVTMGKTIGAIGAGQLYFRVPVTLIAQTTDQQSQTFVGCYELHLAQPVIQDAPPFHPMAIRSAAVQPLKNGANEAELMAQACPAA